MSPDGAGGEAEGPGSEVTGPERDIVIACLAGDEPGAYNVPVFVRFDEPVDIPRLVEAARRVLAASPALRTTYARSGRSLTRRASAPPPPVDLLRAHPSELTGLAEARRIAVTDPILVRAAVIDLDAPGRPHLFLNVHHALADGISLSLILRAVLDAYVTGEVAVLAGPESDAAPERLTARRTADLTPWAPTPADTGAFLAALAARATPGSGVSVTERAIETHGIPTYAESLAAFVPALADWLGVETVVVATALAGRPIGSLRAIGNFVRLQPLALSARATTDHADLARRLAIASADPGAPPPPSDPLTRAASVAVVFDYKRESLVARRIHPGVAAYLVADDGYRDVKYDLHVSLYQCAAVQHATLTARDLPADAVTGLLGAYAARLTPARPASTSVPSVPSVPSGAPRATASEEALRACS